ncbi:MAG TPA: response regulator transcription factor [Ferruginibacter sp.]|nr:response regulator transcription factor [Ferruginibacter sp.]HRE63226.1 response regulator transcription factor [Ferruginibacter sp.]
MVVKIVVYEDNKRLRESLLLLLENDHQYKVVGSFANCITASEDIRATQPDLVLMDIDMPGITGIEGVKIIKEHFPDVKIVMHTVFEDDSRIFDSICAGADGYLLKNISPLKLLESLKEVMDGAVPMSPFVAQRVFQHFRTKEIIPVYNLTKREKEILLLLVKGNSYKMIASILTISVDTVKKHLQNTYHKLHVSCGTEAVAKAIRHKIVPVE